MRLFCFGFGYSAAGAGASPERLATSALAGHRDQHRRSQTPPLGAKLAAFQGDGASAEVRNLLARHHAPARQRPAGPRRRRGAAPLPRRSRGPAELAWVGYLSTVGVYGDWQGQWVDETSPTRPISGAQPAPRAVPRAAWLAFGERERPAGRDFPPVRHLRPGRSVIDNLQGRHRAARRQAGPGVQPHPRRRHRPGAGRGHRQGRGPQPCYNVSDDEPAPPQDVSSPTPPSCWGRCRRRIPFEKAGTQGHGGDSLLAEQAANNALIKRSGRCPVSDLIARVLRALLAADSPGVQKLPLSAAKADKIAPWNGFATIARNSNLGARPAAKAEITGRGVSLSVGAVTLCGCAVVLLSIIMCSMVLERCQRHRRQLRQGGRPAAQPKARSLNSQQIDRCAQAGCPAQDGGAA